jgi:hypothetical protein
MGGPSSGSTGASSTAAQPAASENGSGTEVASAGNSSSAAELSTNASTASSGSSGGSSGSSGSSTDGSSSVVYAAAGGSSSGATISSTSSGAVASGSTGQTSGGSDASNGPGTGSLAETGGVISDLSDDDEGAHETAPGAPVFQRGQAPGTHTPAPPDEWPNDVFAPPTQRPIEPLEVVAAGPVPPGYIAPDLYGRIVEGNNLRVQDQVYGPLRGSTTPTGLVPSPGLSVPSGVVLSRDQQLLNWYHKVMQEMIRVGNALRGGGPRAVSVLPGYKSKLIDVRPGSADFTYDAGTLLNPAHFPAPWPELAAAIRYSIDNYASAGAGSVMFGGFIIADTGVPPSGIAINYRDLFYRVGPPLTLIRPDVFYKGDMTTYATLVHEPLHDSVWWHDGMKNLLPTGATPDGGAGTDAFSEFWTFLHNARDATGTTLWQMILSNVGPPPVPLGP